MVLRLGCLVSSFLPVPPSETLTVFFWPAPSVTPALPITTVFLVVFVLRAVSAITLLPRSVSVTATCSSSVQVAPPVAQLTATLAVDPLVFTLPTDALPEPAPPPAMDGVMLTATPPLATATHGEAEVQATPFSGLFSASGVLVAGSITGLAPARPAGWQLPHTPWL